jgi:hypothetical protein
VIFLGKFQNILVYPFYFRNHIVQLFIIIKMMLSSFKTNLGIYVCENDSQND